MPKIKNLATQEIISSDAKFASSLIDKSLGLLLPKNPRALIFKTRFGLHTFFLKKPIDILVLDQNNLVVKIKRSLKPNRLFFWNPKYNLVIELPKNSTKKVRISDQISIK